MPTGTVMSANSTVILRLSRNSDDDSTSLYWSKPDVAASAAPGTAGVRKKPR